MSTDTHGRVTGRDPDDDPLLVVARFEGRNRLRMTAVLAVLFSLFGLLYVWVGPQMIDAGFSELLDAMPPVVTELFGFESLESIEGLLASEFYTLGWIVGLGGYLAYTAAGTVAGDLRDERMDTVLSGPVPRRSVLLGKFLAVLVPIAALNVVVPVVLYVASLTIGESLSVVDLAIVHAFSIPYLLFWSAGGILLGVVVRRGRAAGRVALGLLFFSWLFESVISTTEYDWLGALSPVRYFDPPGILVDGTYDIAGAGLLLAGAVVALGLGQYWFRRRDL
ncbi:ABC transporter permease subunit [Halorhabdus sp. BNX81]|uniref:ABC transporter permease n=1 Tax=Halorhabdus sp. BNX81 TaxID=2980181 RepID=UPI0023DD5031|nr:ABC transporter permease subunit [Halorhabdus sp. BNX81]WEL22685.1 ABC-type transport system involved in multi-copper enzyme maturation, permease component [Halorhabdus sp. BNX81]